MQWSAGSDQSRRVMDSQWAVCAEDTPPASPNERDGPHSTELSIRDKSLSLLQLDPADRVVHRIADKRDAIQKKTFTKWVNKHLAKIGRAVDDLFEDVRDGHHLIWLLEVLSGHQLPRERGRMRLHKLQNVQTALNYLRYRKIKLVNIRAEDIVDGNAKLILGLIWTIILHLQIADIVGHDGRLTAREALLHWAQRTTAPYADVRVSDLTRSWRDGLAFNAIIHRNRPDLVEWRSLKERGIRHRLEAAFRVAEREYGVTRLLDPEDVDTNEPDEKSLITYISSLYDVFPHPPAPPIMGPVNQRGRDQVRAETPTAIRIAELAPAAEELNRLPGDGSEHSLEEDTPVEYSASEMLVTGQPPLHDTDEIPSQLGDQKVHEANGLDAVEMGPLQLWLQECSEHLASPLRVSADGRRLRDQLERNESLLQEMNNKGPEIMAVLDGGRRLAKRSSGGALSLEEMGRHWNSVRHAVASRHERLTICMDLWRKYEASKTNVTLWLRQVEGKVGAMQPVAFRRSQLEEQVGQLQTVRDQVRRHCASLDTHRAIGESFLSSCDVDQAAVREELSAAGERLDALDAALLRRAQTLVDMALRLTEFSVLTHDTLGAIQRCERRLATYDALTPATRDPKWPDRIRQLLARVVVLEKEVQRVQRSGASLTAEASSGHSDASHIQEETERLAQCYQQLRRRLQIRCSSLATASQEIRFEERIKKLADKVSILERQLEAMPPPGRRLQELADQSAQMSRFGTELDACRSQVDAVVAEGRNLLERQSTEQLEALGEAIRRLEDGSQKRTRTIHETCQEMQRFYDLFHDITRQIDQLSTQEEEVQLATSTHSPRQQQGERRALRQEFESLNVKLDAANGLGQRLLQSAADDVSTGDLRSDLQEMNNRWRGLKEKMDERERNAEEAAQFRQVLQDMSGWLSQMERALADQQPPSGQYQVAKAQLQQPKLVKQSLHNRRRSLASLLDAGRDVASRADATERADLERRLQEMVARFDAAADLADHRIHALRKTMVTTRELENKSCLFARWLQNTQRKVAALEVIPADQAAIQQRIVDHEQLHDDITSKASAYDALVQVATQLKTLVAQEEADALNDQLCRLTDRYESLVTQSHRLRQLLGQCQAEMGHWDRSHDTLRNRLKQLESQLSRVHIRSVRLETLQMQMGNLIPLAEQVGDEQRPLESLADAALDLMRHLSSEDIARLRQKVDAVRDQFSGLTNRVGELLCEANDSLLVADQFYKAHGHMADWLRSVERRIEAVQSQASDSQSDGEVLDRLQSELVEFGPLLDGLNQIGAQLSCCYHDERAFIEAIVSPLNRRFDGVRQQTEHEIKCLQVSKERCAELASDLDNLLHWFRETESQLRQVDPPNSDAELILAQLEEHEIVSDKIANQKQRAQCALCAGRQVRHNGRLIAKKMDALRYAADLVSRLCADRLGLLEQALQLARHLDRPHPELRQWFEESQTKLANTHPRADQTGGSSDLLLATRSANVPVDAESSETGLDWLAAPHDEEDGVGEPNVGEPNVGEEQRLDQERSGQVPVSASGMQSTLSRILDQVKSTVPVAARPERIQETIRDNHSIMEHLEKLEPALGAVKIAAGHSVETGVQEKAGTLSGLWNAAVAAAAERGRWLEEALQVAECFWEEVGESTATLKELQDNLAALESADPSQMQRQRQMLDEIKQHMEQCKHEIDFCRQTGQELASLCDEGGRSEIDERVDHLSLALDQIGALHADRERQLTEATERDAHCADVLDSLERAGDKLRQLRLSDANVDDQMRQLEALRTETDMLAAKVEAFKSRTDEAVRNAPAEEASRLKDSQAQVTSRWEHLLRTTLETRQSLERARLLGQFQHSQADPEGAAVEDRGLDGQVQHALSWLHGLDQTLSTTEPMGALPETVSEQLRRFMEVLDELEERCPPMEHFLRLGAEYLRSTDGADSSLSRQLHLLERKWHCALDVASRKKIVLEIHFDRVVEFHDDLQEFVDWLTGVEIALTNAKPTSRVLQTVLGQIEEHRALQRDAGAKRQVLLALEQRGAQLRRSSPGADATLVKNVLHSVRDRWERALSKAAQRTQTLDYAYQETKEFHDSWKELSGWLQDTEQSLDQVPPPGKDPDSIKRALAKHKELQRALGAQQSAYDALVRRGKLIQEHGLEADRPTLQQMLTDAMANWRALCHKATDRQRKLEEGLLCSGQFHDAVRALADWIGRVDPAQMADGPVHGDLDTVAALREQHRLFREELSSRMAQTEQIGRTAAELMATVSQEEQVAIRQQVAQLETNLHGVAQAARGRSDRLDEALARAQVLHNTVHMLVDWLSDAELKFRWAAPLPEDESQTMQLVGQQDEWMEQMAEKEAAKEDAIAQARHVLSQCHPDAATTVRHWIKVIESRWEEVAAWAHQRRNRLEEHLRSLAQAAALVAELSAWLTGAENSLAALETESLPDDLLAVEALIEEHRVFMEHLAKRQDEVHRVCKERRSSASSKTGGRHYKGSPARTKASPGRQVVRIGHLVDSPSTAGSGRQREANADRVVQLWDQWCRVWMLAWDRLRHLQEKLTRLRQASSTGNSPRNWPFLKDVNDDKSPVLDAIRHLDTGDRGAVSRRSNWRERRSSDEIYHEVERQVRGCTCTDGFAVRQVGQGLYRFGDSQKLRLVRILRSTVMVRVGGGWVALDEFLARNDHCRAKGRTNLELREQLVLADGRYQTMSPGKTASPSGFIRGRMGQNAAVGSTSLPTRRLSLVASGPITKIREKSVTLSHSKRVAACFPTP